MKRSFILYFASLALAFLTSGVLLAQPGYSPYHLEVVSIDLGVHHGLEYPLLSSLPDDHPNPTYTETDYVKVVRTLTSQKEAPWMQLQFDGVHLGQRSFLTIRSLADDEVQHFDSESIATWRNWSAMFKGNTVEVTLFVAPNETNISIKIVQLLVGDFVGGRPIPLRSQCGPNDDRTSSGIPMRDGRIMPVTCTGWMHAAGFYATAGHCLDGSSSSLDIMEFDVPASLCDGTTQPAAVNNQYPIIYSSIVWENGNIGNDWGFYDVGANSNTGLSPLEARRSYYHLTKANPTSNIQIRGFGSDNVPEGCNGGRNADNFTLQWHAGPNFGENIDNANDVDWEYQADTEGGNSGSAIRAISEPDLHHAIGIHTNAGCSTSSGGTSGNRGTSFEADDTENAMNVFWQTEVEYVDVDHHLSNTTGSTVWPHYLLQNALNQANAGHGPAESALELILIAGSNRLTNTTTETGGIYAESISYSGATNGVILRRTAGAVKIGPNAAAFSTPNPISKIESSDTDIETTNDSSTDDGDIRRGGKQH